MAGVRGKAITSTAEDFPILEEDIDGFLRTISAIYMSRVVTFQPARGVPSAELGAGRNEERDEGNWQASKSMGARGWRLDTWLAPSHPLPHFLSPPMPAAFKSRELPAASRSPRNPIIDQLLPCRASWLYKDRPGAERAWDIIRAPNTVGAMVVVIVGCRSLEQVEEDPGNDNLHHHHA
ncbi:hypothetical protein BKA80DRAFT_254618 [Phyllosticta citrichinensis]